MGDSLLDAHAQTDPAADTPVDQRTDGPGVTHLDPNDPALPYYVLLSTLRSPLTLRELMIQPVRTGYIGQAHRVDPSTLPPSAAELYAKVAVSDVLVPSPAGPVRCQVFSPPASGTTRPLMLYVHGGGFTVGQSEDTAYITSRIAWENGMVVVSVNYRLAPEWPFPAGLDDCLAVLRWLRAHGHELGGDPALLAVAGDSAGGNFAAALPLKARDEGVPVPEAAVLLCPITDFFVEEHDSFERLAPLGVIYDTAFVGFVRGAYVVHRRLWSHPHVSPARGDLGGYPPTLIVSGTADPMIDDNRAFAGKLRGAGVSRVEHFIEERMPHGYYFFPHLLPAGDEAFGAIARFLRETLNAPGQTAT
jgi:acetyl esterase